MLTPKEWNALIERARNGVTSAEDLDTLRQLQLLMQLKKDGSFAFEIDELKGEEIHIGDRITIEQISGQKVIHVSADEIKTREFNLTSPYKGLKKFEAEDKDYFFGRDQFITELANDLEQTNLLLLLGASGSGKSSVVRAGLLSWLQKKWGARLVILTFTPDQDPFESLYASLLRYYRQSEVQFVRDGRENTLTQIVTELQQSDSFWFIFIDQFEELFTTSQAEKCDRFIASLVNLNTVLKSQGSTRDCPVKIVSTMRADFLDRLSPYPVLVKATDKHRPLIAEMRVDELRQAIGQPAALHGVVFETGLVEEIIKDVQGQAGYLPLLQYMLNLLWETEVQTGEIHNRTLNISSYYSLGRVRGALQQRVEQIYQALPKAEQLAAQRIFLRLVGIGGEEELETEWRPVRRRALRSEFDSGLEQQVLMQLINENLLVSNQQPQTQEATVEIAHEALLTSWQTLNAWIKDNRQAIALRNRLNDDVTRWQANKAEDELWTGSKLERVLELKKNLTFNQVLGGFSPAANQFIDASLGRRDRELRLYRNTAISGLLAATCIAAISVLAGVKWQDANQGQITALSNSARAIVITKPTALEALVEALKAGEQFQQTTWLNNSAALKSEVMDSLGQATYLVREQNRLQGHSNYVQQVRFSPDNQLIATAGYDNTAKLWSVYGKELRTFKGHADVITDIAFSPDSKTIATTSSDKTTKLWDQNGNLRLTLQGHTKSVESVSFSPDGQLIATAGDDGTIKLWSLNGKPQGTLRKHQGAIYRVVFSHNGQLIATASEDSTAGLWNRKTGKVQFLKGHTKPVTSISFAPDDQTVATASNDQTVILWNWITGKPKAVLKGHTDEVKDVSFSPDGQTLATASADGTVKLWGLDGTLLDTLKGHNGRVNSVTFSKDGEILASSSNDKTARLWQVRPSRLMLLGNYSDSVYNLSISPNGQMIAAASPNTIKIVQRDGKLIRQWQERDPVKAIEFSPDGKIIATGSNTKLKLWDLQGNLLRTIGQHSQPIPTLSFSPDGKEIAAADFAGVMKFWDLSGKLLYTRKVHDGAIFDIRFSPDGKWVATASWDKTVKIWDRDKTLVQTLKGHEAPVYGVSFSPDSQQIATASEDNTVKLWSIDGKELSTLKGHTAAVIEVAFSPNGQIATASNDSTIKLWDPQGQLITTLRGHRYEVNVVRFAHDGKLLVSGSSDKTVLVWDVENLTLKSLVKQGCNWLKNYLINNQNAPKTICQASKE
jgi:WD40 repeat protein